MRHCRCPLCPQAPGVLATLLWVRVAGEQVNARAILAFSQIRILALPQCEGSWNSLFFGRRNSCIPVWSEASYGFGMQKGFTTPAWLGHPDSPNDHSWSPATTSSLEMGMLNNLLNLQENGKGQEEMYQESCNNLAKIPPIETNLCHCYDPMPVIVVLRRKAKGASVAKFI